MKEKYIPIFVKIAEEISKLSTCSYRKVGAIIVKDNSIIAEGYNGAPRGMVECAEVDKLIDSILNENETEYEKIKNRIIDKYDNQTFEYVLSRIRNQIYNNRGELFVLNKKLINFVHNLYEVHAEINAITTAARLGYSLQDTEILVTHKPCIDCAKAIVSSGIKRVYYIYDYKSSIYNGLSSDEFFKLSGIDVIRISNN
jgi:dCMP deaminase